VGHSPALDLLKYLIQVGHAVSAVQPFLIFQVAREAIGVVMEEEEASLGMWVIVHNGAKAPGGVTSRFFHLDGVSTYICQEFGTIDTLFIGEIQDTQMAQGTF